MASDATVANQKQILANQRKVLANQKRIEANQRKLDQLLRNQKKLDRILANQKRILSKLAEVRGIGSVAGDLSSSVIPSPVGRFSQASSSDSAHERRTNHHFALHSGAHFRCIDRLDLDRQPSARCASGSQPRRALTLHPCRSRWPDSTVAHKSTQVTRAGSRLIGIHYRRAPVGWGYCVCLHPARTVIAIDCSRAEK